MASTTTSSGCSSMPITNNTTTSGRSTSSSNLTFGLEYEFKLRVTAEQLQQELRSNPTTSNIEVVTNPGRVRLSTAGPQYLQNDYLNFAFRDPGNHPQSTTLVSKTTGKQCDFRGYTTEALKIVQRCLQAIPDYHSTTIYQGASKQQDFSSARLHLTNDTSLNGLTNATKVSRGLCTPEEANTTDFIACEIVTAPHSSLEEASEEIAKVSTALCSDHLDYHMDDECAMHIHVGKEDGTPFSLKTLQHLAYLVLVYEHEAARWTIPRNRGADFETASNRVDFATECPAPEPHHAYICDKAGAITEGSVEVIWNYQSLAEIRKALFDDVDAAEDPLKAFVKLMGSTKGRIVNFSYCGRDITNNEPAATVEFRQHQGTLDSGDVLHWGRHCTALVALAEKYATTNTQCPITAWTDTIDIEQLWREMTLPESTRHFYRCRIQEFDARWPDVHPTPLCEPDMVFDDDFSFSDDEESEDSEPDMTEAEVQEK
ncbi:hypothetical protein D6D15_08572 [Aureobasidium pullulans]|uniref:Amidoligase enzyme n=1 Tax=Aureobasidium pullulans TaxID=5580 RepID=A0A4S9AYW4_AURPU|nr:hypothetical protein D6D15_08572 [Aureobasidium pullulans]